MSKLEVKPENFNVILQPYCEHCNLFDPDVEEVSYEVLNLPMMAKYTVTCKHAAACQAMYERMINNE